MTSMPTLLARHGRPVVEQADLFVSRVRKVGHSPTGRLKIALPMGPPRAGLDQIRSTLKSGYPDLQVEIFFDASLEILFADEVAGSVRERLVIPKVLVDLPRIQQFVELAQETILGTTG